MKIDDYEPSRRPSARGVRRRGSALRWPRSASPLSGPCLPPSRRATALCAERPIPTRVHPSRQKRSTCRFCGNLVCPGVDRRSLGRPCACVIGISHAGVCGRYQPPTARRQPAPMAAEPGSVHRCGHQPDPPPDIRPEIHWAVRGRARSANFGVLAAVQLHEAGVAAAFWGWSPGRVLKSASDHPSFTRPSWRLSGGHGRWCSY